MDLNSQGDNPQVFPLLGDQSGQWKTQEGMTLLDWFAGQALAGLVAGGTSPEDKADRCYTDAAAMLAERKRIMEKGTRSGRQTERTS